MFTDPLALAGYDPDHSAEEDRYITIGTSIEGRLLAISHTDRDNRLRPINAREASPRAERPRHLTFVGAPPLLSWTFRAGKAHNRLPIPFGRVG